MPSRLAHGGAAAGLGIRCHSLGEFRWTPAELLRNRPHLQSSRALLGVVRLLMLVTSPRSHKSHSKPLPKLELAIWCPQATTHGLTVLNLHHAGGRGSGTRPMTPVALLLAVAAWLAAPAGAQCPVVFSVNSQSSTFSWGGAVVAPAKAPFTLAYSNVVVGLSGRLQAAVPGECPDTVGALVQQLGAASFDTTPELGPLELFPAGIKVRHMLCAGQTPGRPQPHPASPAAPRARATRRRQAACRGRRGARCRHALVPFALTPHPEPACRRATIWPRWSGGT